jgi:hypothetical protein
VKPARQQKKKTSEAPVQPDEGFRRAAGAAAFVFLALYAAFPDKVYVFDGIMFSDVIERNVDAWRAQLFNQRHLLFNPFMMALRDGLGLLHVSTGAYTLIQKVNAVLGVLSLALFFRLLDRLTEDRALASLGAVSLGISFGVWSRATEGQVYMFMTFWGLAAGLCAFKLAEEAVPRAAYWLAGSLVGGVLFHAADAALFPMAAAAVWFAYRRGKSISYGAALLAMLGIVVPYIWAFKLTNAAALRAFLSAATDVYATNQAGLLSSVIGFFLGRDSSTAVLLTNAFQSAAASPWGGLFPITGGALAVFFCAASAAWLWARRPERRAAVTLLILWGGGFVLLDAVWHGGVYFWSIPCAAGLALVLLAIKEGLAQQPQRRGPVLAGLAVLAAVLAGWNLFEGIIPQSRLDNNVGYRRSLFVRDHTVASSWVLISGFGYPNAKVYLPYFAHRTREVLEYYLDRYPREQGLALYTKFIKRNRDFGIPMYILSDLVDDPAVDELLKKNFKVGPEDVRACFGPGSLILMAQQDTQFKIFLFAPKDEADRLFTVLGYSVLSETDMPRLKETVGALRKIAEEMTPAQRRQTLQVMRQSDYGFKLLYGGFANLMSPESLQRTDDRSRKFDEWQKQPAFHLRLGNLYGYLGLIDEVRREWTIAYQGTHDPGLAADIAKLPR